MMHPVEVGPKFVHYFAGEEEGRGRSQEHGLVRHLDTGGPGHIVERSGIAADIVGGMSADQVLVVGATIVNHVSGGGDLSGGGIVGGLVAVYDTIAKPDFHVAAHLVNVLALFLFIGANQDFVAVQDHVGWRTRIAGILFGCALHLVLHNLFHHAAGGALVRV